MNLSLGATADLSNGWSCSGKRSFCILQAMSFDKHKTGLLIAVLLACYFFWNPWKAADITQITICLALFMISFWILEIVPLAVTALSPLVLFPLSGVSDIGSTARHYADPIIFLFMGGFFIALAIEKWNLHRRMALTILSITGSNGNQILLGFMLSTFSISMWLSNTATTMMMLPIVLSVLSVLEKSNPGKSIDRFSISALLGTAYASNIGGLATIIGTPPNVAFVAYAREQLGMEISFFQWMLICTPIALLLLGAIYWVFVKVLFPNDLKHQEETQHFICAEKEALGPWRTPEIRTFAVFILAAVLWILKEPLAQITGWNLHDSMIGMGAGLLLFVLPSGMDKNPPSGNKTHEAEDDRLLIWSDTSRMNWGVLLMFGGGLTLAKAMEQAGIIADIGKHLSAWSPEVTIVTVFLVATVSIFLSELMSNVAQVIVMAPIIGSMALSMDQDPLLLGLSMTLSASCAGMLPMGTPPNAIVFASGKIPLKMMLKAGLILNLISIVLISLMCYWIIQLSGAGQG